MLPASAAIDALGLGDLLGQQVDDETEDMRKKRMAEMAQRQQLGPTGSLAVTSLFGPMGDMNARA